MENSRKNKIKLHQSYKFLTKEMGLKLRYARHPQKKREAKRALKKLQSFGKKLISQLKKAMSQKQFSENQELFTGYIKILNQKRQDKNKTYSLHEPQVYCMAKGKEHKAHEFGCKASIALTKDTGIIVAAITFEKKQANVNTLEQTLKQV